MVRYALIPKEVAQRTWRALLVMTLIASLVPLTGNAVARAQDPYTISGTLLNGITGEPFAGEEVSFTGYSEDLGGDLAEVTTTDAAGAFEFTFGSTPAFISGTVTAQPDGFTEGSEGFSFSPPDGEMLEILVEPLLVIEGTVTDLSGNPLSGIAVSAWSWANSGVSGTPLTQCGRGRCVTAETDASGYYRVEMRGWTDAELDPGNVGFAVLVSGDEYADEAYDDVPLTDWEDLEDLVPNACLGDPVCFAELSARNRAFLDYVAAESDPALMGAAGETVTADFVLAPEGSWEPDPPPVAPGSVFTDDDGSVFENDIEWLAAEGITKGCNPPVNDQFCPEAAVTRGQMAAFLTRALGLTDDGGGNKFIDDNGSVFEADIAKLAAAGITKGCNPPTNDRFCPDGDVTRGQMAAFLVRALGYVDDGGGDLFIDDDDSVFRGDIDRLGTAGVTKGCNPPKNDRYCPDQLVTRGQMAAFLRRALG